MKMTLLAVVGTQIFLVIGTAHAGAVPTVPEPGTLALLGIGAAAAAGAWWRNRK